MRFEVYNFIMCCLYQIEIGALLGDCMICLCLTSFIPHFVVSALCLKCTKHVDLNSDVVR